MIPGTTKNMTHRLLGAGVTLLAATMLLTACGSSGNKVAKTTAAATSSSASAGATASSTTASSAAASSATASSPAVAVGSSGGSFCLKAKIEQAQDAKDISEFTNDTPAELEKFERKALATLPSYLAVAPAQIKGALVTLVTDEEKFFKELQAVKFDYTKVGPAVAKTFEAPAFTKATDTVTAYLKTVCKISSP